MTVNITIRQFNEIIAELLGAAKKILFRSLAYFNRKYFCLCGRDNCSKTNAFQWYDFVNMSHMR